MRAGEDCGSSWDVGLARAPVLKHCSWLLPTLLLQ